MHYYLKFDFDLGYGEGLPVILEIDPNIKESLTKFFQNDYSDDDFISFDENYVTINSIIQSAQFFEMETPIPTPLKNDYIINPLITFFQKPYRFPIIEIPPKQKQDKPERRIEEFIHDATPFLRAEEANPMYNSAAALTRLGQDPRLFSSIEDAITSAQLFGICPECDAVMHEEGCIICQNYEG